MPLRSLIDSASFAPETLEVIYKAFDLAWAEMAPQHADDPARAAFVRDMLARAVLGAAETETKDAFALKSAALEAFARMKPLQG